MIQRIQTVYLLVSAVLLGLMFFFPLGRIAYGAGAEAGRMMVWGYETPASASSFVTGGFAIAATALLGVTTLLVLGTVFLYRNRPLQKRLCTVSVALLAVLVAMLVGYVRTLPRLTASGEAPLDFTVLAVFPFLSVVLILLARRGVVSDERLVRSLDRIR